jgi:hypothetical protein
MPQSSGPTYPLYPPGTAPVQNQIGGFVIGISPIGDIPPFNVWTTIISQYANSEIITELCSNFADYFDQTANMDAFYDTIMNVATAEGYGLDVWGRIVGVNRVLTLTSGIYFGFEQQSPQIGTFGQGIFYDGQSPLTSNFSLTDDAFRILIYAKALANICNGSIPAINQILLSLFPGQGNCYVTDGMNLTMTYTFDFALSPVQAAIIASGILPRTSGVLATVVQGA